MTKEDLMSKLLQRADFVAQREELDEMHEVTRRSYGDDFILYWALQENPSMQVEVQYTNAKYKQFYLDILNQLRSFWINKESMSESGSELDWSISATSKCSQYTQIDNLVKQIKRDSSIIEYLDDKICEIAKNLGLSLKRNVLDHKKQQLSTKTDTVYAEKYKRIIEVHKEIIKCEQNIKKNYSHVDNMIIPQLKLMSADYKTKYKKYKQLKRLLEEHRGNEKLLEDKLQRVESQIRMRLRYKSNSASSLHNEHYQIEPESEEYFQEGNDNLKELELQYKQAWILQQAAFQELSQVEQKMQLLQSFKEQNEIELRQSVDGLKHELRAVREELKTLEKEKQSIAGKLMSIESKYNEAKESFKNAEEVLSYTNRLIIHNNNSVRASMASDGSRYLRVPGSQLMNESNGRLESESSASVLRNTNSRLGLDFYSADPHVEDLNEDEADISSSEIFNR